MHMLTVGIVVLVTCIPYCHFVGSSAIFILVLADTLELHR